MSCDKMEQLLLLYAEGALSESDRRRVDDHVAVCGACREALAGYRELESLLVSRRVLRPQAARTARTVAERLGVRRRRRPLVGWIGLPGLASAGSLIVGIVSYLYRDAVAEFFGRVAQQLTSGQSRIAGEMAQGLVQAAGGSEWVLLAVYLGVFATIMLAGSWVVLRFVRT